MKTWAEIQELCTSNRAMFQILAETLSGEPPILSEIARDLEIETVVDLTMYNVAFAKADGLTLRDIVAAKHVHDFPDSTADEIDAFLFLAGENVLETLLKDAVQALLQGA